MFTEPIDRKDTAVPFSQAFSSDHKSAPLRLVISSRAPLFILGAMVVAILLMNAALPLRVFWFHDALLTQFGDWPVWLTWHIFPDWGSIPPVSFVRLLDTPDVVKSWAELPFLLGTFVIVFLVYLAALRTLPERVSWRFTFRSTLPIGILFAFIPIVTSPDVYSYIAYARMSVFHDLNPLTTLPTAIRTDPVYNFVLWVDQPSAYGPTWAVITSFIQWILARLGMPWVAPMLISLRLLGLAMHLVSVRLVWSITGKLQQLRGHSEPFPTRERLCATLAFAWNPLLLFEACVNAHTDTTLLVFVLLVLWTLAQGRLAAIARQDIAPDTEADRHKGHSHLLVPASPPGASAARSRSILERVTRLPIEARSALRQLMQRLIVRIPADLRTPIAASSLLALATCLKINIVLFFPGLLFYLWIQAQAGRRLRHAAVATASYIGVIVLFYAPFWQGGAIFTVFKVNPATYRAINTVTEFLAHAYNSAAALLGYPLGAPIGSPAERFLHTFSMGIFALIYLYMLWRMIRSGWRMRTLNGLIYWMAVVWLLYCAIGSPWFWPWYMVTFFGLYALLESGGDAGEGGDGKESFTQQFPWSLQLFRTPWIARLLSFSLLSFYWLITWGPAHTFVPGLPGFLWSYLSGVWIWILPLVGMLILNRKTSTNS